MTIRIRYIVTISLYNEKPTISISGFFNNSDKAIEYTLKQLDKTESLYVKRIDVKTQEIDIEEV